MEFLMYSGTTLTRASGRILGAHQKIDRVARKQLGKLLQESSKFPRRKTILHFEGRNGPDGVKSKSPAQDEPWHYFNPFDEDDTQLTEIIEGHYKNLVKALKNADEVVAGFEAAWLAHAVVDGLTPAHHFPYEEKLVELRNGEGIETRTSIKEKIIMPGENRVDSVKNNWKMWGPKGLMTTHGAFEWGVATIMLPMRLPLRQVSAEDLAEIRKTPAVEYFVHSAKEIAALGLYEKFYKYGWTSKLARAVRRQLVPTILKTVTLIWYKAACDAGVTKAK
jgi:hypothetical protein